MQFTPASEALTGGCRDAVLLNDWHVVALSSEVVVGELVPTTLFERDLVVWRDEARAVHVWDDLCLHRGARLSKGFIQDDKVVCPYHGWNYDKSAQCVLMPAAPRETPMRKARATAHHAVEKYGFVWACVGTPERDVPPFPEWDDPSYKKVVCGPYTFKSGYRAIENFIDATHFPFVHAGLNGIQDNPDTIPPYEVDETEEGLATSAIRVTEPFGDPQHPGDRRLQVQMFSAAGRLFQKAGLHLRSRTRLAWWPGRLFFDLFRGAGDQRDRQPRPRRLRDEFRADAER